MDQILPPATGQRAFLDSAPASKLHIGISALACLMSVLAVAIAAPFANVTLPELPGFVPAYESALWICDGLTALLLFAHFNRSRLLSTLILAAGYLMSSLIIVPHLAAFPGVFSPRGLFFGQGQTVAWLYVFWQGLFPLFVLLHSIAAEAERRRNVRIRRRGSAIAAAVLTVAVMVACAVWLAMHPNGVLPVISTGGDYSRMLTSGVAVVLLLLTTAAILMLLRSWRTSVLDVWLLAVLCSWVSNIVVSSMISHTRFDLGWYTGRVLALFSGMFLLVILLLDLGRLYTRLEYALDDARAQNEALVRSREELLRVQRLEAIGQLTGGIAHDFNNILTAIIGNLEMIGRRAADPARVTQLSNHGINAAYRGAQLIKQLLTFSRKQNLNPQIADPNTLLLELKTLAAKALGENKTLSFDLDERLRAVCVDMAEFQASMLNLVSNASDAMPNGGAVRMTTRNLEAQDAHLHGLPAQPWVLISVSDTGVGMDKATLARVFEPFFTTKDVGKGTGLGLSHVYGFAESAAGKVEIASVPMDGTTVSLFLPGVDAPAVDRPQPAGARGVAAAAHVLLVEDDEDVRRTTADLLADAGYEVTAAADGDAAMALLGGALDADILLSDVAMPGSLNGFQLASEASRLRPGLKVLLISGYAQKAASRPEADGVLVLSKPFHIEELLERLSRLAPRPGDPDKAVAANATTS